MRQVRAHRICAPGCGVFGCSAGAGSRRPQGAYESQAVCPARAAHRRGAGRVDRSHPGAGRVQAVQEGQGSPVRGGVRAARSKRWPEGGRQALGGADPGAQGPGGGHHHAPRRRSRPGRDRQHRRVRTAAQEPAQLRLRDLRPTRHRLLGPPALQGPRQGLANEGGREVRQGPWSAARLLPQLRLLGGHRIGPPGHRLTQAVALRRLLRRPRGGRVHAPPPRLGGAAGARLPDVAQRHRPVQPSDRRGVATSAELAHAGNGDCGLEARGQARQAITAGQRGHQQGKAQAHATAPGRPVRPDHRPRPVLARAASRGRGCCAEGRHGAAVPAGRGRQRRSS